MGLAEQWQDGHACRAQRGQGEAAQSGGLGHPRTALLWQQRCQLGWVTQQQPCVAAALAHVCCMEFCAASPV